MSEAAIYSRRKSDPVAVKHKSGSEAGVKKEEESKELPDYEDVADKLPTKAVKVTMEVKVEDENNKLRIDQDSQEDVLPNVLIDDNAAANGSPNGHAEEAGGSSSSSSGPLSGARRGPGIWMRDEDDDEDAEEEHDDGNGIRFPGAGNGKGKGKGVRAGPGSGFYDDEDEDDDDWNSYGGSGNQNQNNNQPWKIPDEDN